MDHEGMPGEPGGGLRGEGVIEAVIDFVGDEADALAFRSGHEIVQRGGVIMVPVGLAGLATSTPLSGARRCSAISMAGVIAQRVTAVVSIPTGSQPSAF